MNKTDNLLEFKNKKITVLGMGVSGQAAARWVFSRGAQVLCSDLNPLSNWPKDLVKWCKKNGIGMEACEHRLETCLSSDLIVVSPGVPPETLAVQAARRANIPVIGELALATYLWKGPIIAITGTNGKTTTAMLVDEILKKANIGHVMAGNIGTPLYEFIEGHSEETVAVLEISSFQLDYFPKNGFFSFTPPRFRIAAWLNLAPDHLDRYQDIKKYGESKALIYNFQKFEDWAIRNFDDQRLKAWKNKGPARRLYFGSLPSGTSGARLNSNVFLKKITIMWHDNKCEEYDLENWSPKGRHNIENLACAILISRLTGANARAVKSVIQSFQLATHRLQWIAQNHGVDYYDDSKATNVRSVICALESMDQPLVLILGGRGKNEDYTPLAEAVKRTTIRGAVVIGEEGKVLKRVLDPAIPVIHINGTKNGKKSMKKALIEARSMAQQGDAVLLSPACSSFDMFKNYEERGMIFQEEVQKFND
jgi:UDP-N-acetylmuramoylalanine--D-glutamate ligase